MKTHLCIDIGNTRTKWAIFHNRELIHTDATEVLTESVLNNVCKEWDPAAAIISSVKNHPEGLFRFLKNRCNTLLLGPDTLFPFQNLYATPETLGHDRLALVAGGGALFPENDLLIISAGTCITFDLLLASSKYIGGSIHPGIHMRLKAMHTFTGRLPEVALRIPDNIIGNSTVTSLQVGAVTGATMEIAGMIAAYKRQYPGIKVLLTGGDTELLVTMLENEIFAVPLLSLTGLNEILIYNAPSL